MTTNQAISTLTIKTIPIDLAKDPDKLNEAIASVLPQGDEAAKVWIGYAKPYMEAVVVGLAKTFPNASPFIVAHYLMAASGAELAQIIRRDSNVHFMCDKANDNMLRTIQAIVKTQLLQLH